MTFNYPPDLPITARLQDIAELFFAHPVLIIAGETGSGKTTQLPKLCLDVLRAQSAGSAAPLLIGHTQPRRLAARTVATRIAEELNETLGQTVGCQVRFQDITSDATQIKLMTDGILLAEIQRDRLLKKYNVLIIDEAHERSLNIDFLLGYLKRLLPQRRDLKILITSATLDVERFSQHFDNAPVMVVEGRSFPVDIAYLPEEAMPRKPQDIGDSIELGLDYLLQTEKSGSARGGDVLVFLSGERDILEAARHLRKQQTFNPNLKHCEVVPLYARLTLKEQQKIFSPHAGRRIVLSTNVAETSLTVPGIRYVIDAGDARISRYNHRTRVQRLPIESISQASANQRAGRCGRLEAGICVRLYSEMDFNKRALFTDPEIRRTNLASVVLQLLLLRLGKVEDFPFVDPPDSRHVNEAYQLLEELGAVDRQRKITPRGREIARLPVDPRLGVMLVEAQHKNCLREALVIASALSVQDPRERPVDKKQAADEAHRQWADERSDFVSYLKLWQLFEVQRQNLSQNALRKFCDKNYLSWQRMREWRDIHHQLRVACQEHGWKENTGELDVTALPPAVYANLHQALLAGCLSNIALRQDKRDYLGCRQRKLQIFPGSPQAKKSPRWIMAASLIETTQLYAHGVAMIEAQWVLPLARHLLTREFFEPFFDDARGMPMVFEKISLHGLVLVERQKRFYGDIDSVLARELMIREALVAGRYRGNATFFAANQSLLSHVQDLEARVRRRDLLVDDSALFAFYAQQIPDDIVTVRDLEAWYRKSCQQNPQCLLLKESDVLLRDPGDETVSQFPDSWHWQGNDLKLTYSFDPGHAQDGVTLQVPLALLNQIPESRLSWLVPGLITEKCQALLKQLPKSLRKTLVPLPNTAERLTALLQQKTCSEGQTLEQALCDVLLRHYSLRVTPDDFSPAELDTYYRMNIQVMGERDTVLDQGRDLAALRKTLATQTRDVIQQAAPEQFVQSRLTEWSFGKLDKVLPQQRGDMRVLAYPALQDAQDSVALVLVDTEQEAAYQTQRAMVRLAMLALPQQVKYLQKESLRDSRVRLVLGKISAEAVLKDDLVYAAFADCFAVEKDMPRDREAFDAFMLERKGRLADIAKQLDVALSRSALYWQDLQRSFQQLIADEAKVAVEDMQSQLSHLFYEGFIRQTPVAQLLQYPRYLEAIGKRIEKMRGQVGRDRQMTQQVQRYWKPLCALLDKQPLSSWSPSQSSVRWLVEEWRIAQFAQPMKTLVPVSEKRVEEAWNKTSFPRL